MNARRKTSDARDPARRERREEDRERERRGKSKDSAHAGQQPRKAIAGERSTASPGSRSARLFTHGRPVIDAPSIASVGRPTLVSDVNTDDSTLSAS